MIRERDEKVYNRKPGPFHGTGEIMVRDLLTGPDEMYQAGRVFAHTTVYPGASIGYHIHENESETYYILSGIAEYNDNGSVRTVQAGDVTFAGTGQGHGIKALGNEPVELIALILYDKR